eukprot:GHVU01212230.1.p7 GENE.GHVU01212230.1~~GHVU01212230.1.p7  ORF type:complete len:103 (-),score=9.58 GHVU01212230.1:716-1024(-)
MPMTVITSDASPIATEMDACGWIVQRSDRRTHSQSSNTRAHQTGRPTHPCFRLRASLPWLLPLQNRQWDECFCNKNMERRALQVVQVGGSVGVCAQVVRAAS